MTILNTTPLRAKQYDQDVAEHHVREELIKLVAQLTDKELASIDSSVTYGLSDIVYGETDRLSTSMLERIVYFHEKAQYERTYK